MWQSHCMLESAVNLQWRHKVMSPHDVPNKLDQAAVVLENWQVCWDPKLQFFGFCDFIQNILYIRPNQDYYLI